MHNYDKELKKKCFVTGILFFHFVNKCSCVHILTIFIYFFVCAINKWICFSIFNIMICIKCNNFMSHKNSNGNKCPPRQQYDGCSKSIQP